MRKMLVVLVGAVLAAIAASVRATPSPEKATFAGGCFWCIEAPFDKLEGVVSTVSGYTGGDEENPTCSEVSSGGTGHLESVQVTYDPAKITYQQLLDVYWRQFDPTDAGGSFHDRGHQYTSAVFYHRDAQRVLAEASRAALEKSGRFAKSVVTLIRPAEVFYPAEEYHQDYYKKKPQHYRQYRAGSGRDRFIERIWGKAKEVIAPSPRYRKPADAVLRRDLTKLQYAVTQEDGTEPAFRNEFWDHKGVGIYVDVASGEPLFSSTHKFESGTGWPSFWQPLEPGNAVEKVDRSLFMSRTEVRSKHGDSHLGHVFEDGPAPTGRRYCINSAALRFVPAENLVREGLGEYRRLFE